MYEALANSAEIIAGVLGIAVTVVAIIVQLAATRYNHRITDLFIRDPINLLVLSFFVATTLMCLWVSALSDQQGSAPLHATTMGMITLALVGLLPYFAYVFSFISPINFIKQISGIATTNIDACKSHYQADKRHRATRAVDEIQDVLRSAIDTGDRDIAMTCVEALADLLVHYQQQRQELPAEWFEIDAVAATDADFVSLEPSVLERITRNQTWFEYKVVTLLFTAFGLCIPKLRDVANLIGIKTRQLAVEVTPPSTPLLALCLNCFNSYLRSALNARDPRTTYYILSQYRMVAERLAERHDADNVAVIAKRLQFYGLLGFNTDQPFILEVCAYDLVQMLDRCIVVNSDSIDNILAALLELDRETRSETQEASLLGVRRAQIQAATLFLEIGDDARVDRIVADLQSEDTDRIERLIEQVQNETENEFWEMTPRGINFGFLPPQRRQHLPEVLRRVLAGPG